ncbi:MAG TPA: hypothetical protein PK850_16145 [Ignavibacteria bacterium]|nr:hypothetical protein [Ignavibacteria bacterium]
MHALTQSMHSNENLLFAVGKVSITHVVLSGVEAQVFTAVVGV